MDSTHLDALNLRLSHERVRLANAKTQGEKDLRVVWVAQIEREIEAEKEFLLAEINDVELMMTDDELLEALSK